MSTVEKLLTFYFRTVWEKAGLRWDGDNDSEIKELATALGGGASKELVPINPQIATEQLYRGGYIQLGEYEKVAEMLRGTLVDPPKPAPTPATVERYIAFKFKWSVIARIFTKEPIGVVVATHQEGQIRMDVELPDGKFIHPTPNEYRALVAMMLDNKYWEKINE